MLKSLVRENRTQGSARGRSGNRPSYLDEEISKSKLIKYRIKLSKKEERYRTFPKVTQTTPEQKEIFSLVGIKNPMCLEHYVW
jgi:hypothetical protein